MAQSTFTHDSFVIERTYDWPVTKIFRAWADPRRKARWFAGSADELGSGSLLDFRVAGREMNRGGPPGRPVHTYTAEFRDIVPGQRIVPTTEMLAHDVHISVTVATVEFHLSGARTRLVLTAQGAYLDGRETVDQRKEGSEALSSSLGASLADSEY